MPAAANALAAAGAAATMARRYGTTPGERGESVPQSFGTCPCGEPAVAIQTWFTEWFDCSGLVERYIVTRLCADHKARKPGEDT